MAVDPIESAAAGFPFASGFPLLVERFYAALISAAEAYADPEPSLGGRLLYAGELDSEARALLVAANIAGAASLASTADAAAGKQAVRDGVVDFLVTSLDEALRILKNEIRKRETVAVCVALAPEIVELEMRKRGVLPDLSRTLELAAPRKDQSLLAWRIASSPAVWLPKLDAIALSCLEKKLGAPEPAFATWDSARRWLRLAPRYLGRLAQGVRLMRCDEQTAARFREQVRVSVEGGEIGVPVEIQSVSPPAASIRAQSSFTP